MLKKLITVISISCVNSLFMKGESIKSISSSFVPSEFHPVWWARNNHVMTIAGAGSFEGILTDRQAEVNYRREWFDTPDGDRMAVDFLDASSQTSGPQNPIVVMTHGLESRSSAPFTRRMARSFQRRNFDVAVVNFRSCAGDDDVPKRPGGYHLGFTSDLNFITKKLYEESMNDSGVGRRIYLSGFSLGGFFLLIAPILNFIFEPIFL